MDSDPGEHLNVMDYFLAVFTQTSETHHNHLFDLVVIRRMGQMNLKHPVGVYKTYGTKSIKFLSAVEHLGAKLIHSNIKSMGPGNRVEFENGTIGEFDVVLMNTGYTKTNFDGFVEDCSDETLSSILCEASYVRNLFKRVIHPAIPKGLFFIGFARPGFASIPAIAETQARWAASLAAGECNPLPSEADMIREIATDKFRDERQFCGAARRVGALVDYIPYVNDLASLIGSSPPFLRLLFTDPGLLFKIFFGPGE